MIKSLNNDDLLTALNAETNRDLSSFYCDLDFFVGKISTKFFFSLDFDPKYHHITLTSDEWKNFKYCCKSAEELFKINFINPSYDSIEKNYNDRYNHYQELASTISNIRDEFNLKKIELGKITKEIIRIISSLSNDFVINKIDNNSFSEQQKKLKTTMKTLETYILSKSFSMKDILEQKDLLCEQKGKIESYIELQLGNKNSFKLIEGYIYVLDNLMSHLSKIDEIKKNLPNLYYNIEIDGLALAKVIKSKQEWVEENTKYHSSNTSNINELKKFLLECKDLFGVTDILFTDKNILTAIGISEKQRYANINSPTRTSLFVDRIFNTGLNFILLGDAGAGKTTTMQMYTRTRLQDKDIHAPTIYVLLTRLVATLNKDDIRCHDNKTELLIIGIIKYFGKSGVDIPKDDLLNSFKNSNSLLLLDGLDEVIKKAPWIIQAIIDLSSLYPKNQIITSSRMSGDFINKMPFLGVTLLDFSDEQRLKFFKGWFKDDQNIVANIMDHVSNNDEIKEVVKNPLLATILCILAENDIPLPENEIRLYEERLRLLLGQYDVHKKAYRLSSSSYELSLVARKIAYILHNKGTRYAGLEKIIKDTSFILRERLDVTTVERVVNELIDPCNILIPMTNDGGLGFGHYRYQEYLVACELVNNRGISIGPLLYQVHWRGAFELFSQMTDNIDFIIDWLVISGDFRYAKDTLDSMLKFRSEKDQKEYNELISKHFEQDSLEGLLEKLDSSELFESMEDEDTDIDYNNSDYYDDNDID